MRQPIRNIPSVITISLKKILQNYSFKNLLLIVSIGFVSVRAYSDTPVNGITDFNSYVGWNDLTGPQTAGTTGLTAANVQGYNFTLFSLNNIPDCGIGIEAFTGQTPMVYGFSNSGQSYLSSLKISSNGLRYFDLNAVDISMDNAAFTQRDVTLTGYRNGNPVPGATLTMTLGAATSGALLTNYSVATNNAFKNIDAFVISVPGTDVGAIGVDNINAVNFTDVALPLTLVSFTGQAVSDGVLLNWKTANEVNTQAFQVQRGLNNIFSTIGTITAGNSSNSNTYSYTDYFSYANENVFYRLKITDRDGQTSFSPVIAIKVNMVNKSYSLFPNPLTGNILYIKIPSAHVGSLRVTVSTMSGKIVEKQIIRTDGLTSNQIPLTVRTLPPGVYQVQLTEEETGKVTVLQFVK
ncbi:MAG: T9SS type A sorting domain-containing protein [Chitinophagaceae bacterium]|nr:T9SS type A sorting domain-containing protein [Chitinophagaceae bacterium]